MGNEFVQSDIKVVKEGDPVDISTPNYHYTTEPICKILFDKPYYFCGDCNTMLNMYGVNAEFCSNCGRKVKWE